MNYFLEMERLEPGDAAIRSDDPVLGDGWLLFKRSDRVVSAMNLDEVRSVVERASDHAQAGGWAVGFVTYDAAPAFDCAFTATRSIGRPLAWFALSSTPPLRFRELGPAYESAHFEPGDLEWTEAQYAGRFERVHQALRSGDLYQTNLTFRQRFHLGSSPARWFASRCGVDPPMHAAFISGGNWAVASFSPELFFERDGKRVVMRPMKGTAVVGEAAAEALGSDPKQQAENVMIVDMVRNDLGSVAEVGSVCVPKLFEIEAHRSLLQMTSTVTARTTASHADLVAALFPPASVTGAPKVAACRLIHELESSARGIYCGAIGTMHGERARFSVAIRTAWVDTATGDGEFGIGSGVVWDSDCGAEYAECLAKRDLLLRPGPQWALIESISTVNPAVHAHVSRLEASCRSLGIPAPMADIRSAVLDLDSSKQKARLQVQRDGSYSVEYGSSAIHGPRIRAVLARWPVASDDPNLRMKTTSRAVYDAHIRSRPDVDEVLLYNEAGEITEFCRGNVVLKLDGELVTPDPTCGCLDGIGLGRIRRLLRRRLGIAELRRASAIWFTNAVTGLVPVDLVE